MKKTKTNYQILHYGLTLFVLILISCNTSVDNYKKPNIIIIYADDLGYGDLSIYGGNIPSPNIRRIADAGIKFTDFYVSAPVCTPSRYSLLTGCYPQRSLHKLNRVGMPGSTSHLDSCETILPQYLREAGYQTALYGKWHLGSAHKENLPLHHGFDSFVGHLDGCIDYFRHSYAGLQKSWFKNDEPFQEEGYSTDLITNHALDFIKSQQNNKQPYFIFLAYNSPHYGKSDPADLPDSTLVLSRGTYKGVDIANTLQVPLKYLQKRTGIENSRKQIYSAMINNLDDNIGKLLNGLQQSDSLYNTMIWFISDNGGYSESYSGYASNGKLRGEKGSLYEGGIRVPAMVCWKGKIKEKQIVSQPLCNTDLVPTILKIVGVSHLIENREIDGIDISGVLFKGQNINRNIYWKYNNKLRQTALRDGDWKIVNNELYNLTHDISEQNDLSKLNPDMYKKLDNERNKIEKEMKPYKCK